MSKVSDHVAAALRDCLAEQAATGELFFRADDEMVDGRVDIERLAKRALAATLEAMKIRVGELKGELAELLGDRAQH